MHLFSVHVAKAGGTALRHSLAEAFGERLHLQYDDGPMNPASLRNLDPARSVAGLFRPPEDTACTHGHYHPGRFRIDQEDILFALLRPPVDNIISIYFFWKTFRAEGNPLHDYFMREALTIRDFARLPLVRSLYSFSYFGGFDMGRFDILGDYRNRASAIARLSAAIGHPLASEERLNVTAPSEERQAVEADEALKADLRDILIEDIRFFERHAEGR
ncbi:hypothetical protein J5J86_19780 [Aquabacter sp. L1I39]|uniref:hypothetical protein n=1 Tax=Aquabacter sp. L1I39 TaxID=2820278 RepID=UPI001ADA97D2|nr:hypothetical protein [Aquabacter sp. L1I39]QTL02983.1 hypothetical protein J5J86_19780 [Aquabacter sp. L1I39]